MSLLKQTFESFNPRFMNDWICIDCGKDCFVDDKDYYMVSDELWSKYGVGDSMLCMDCIECRIGRKLTKEDISKCALNEVMNPYTKNILNS